jgi:vanillate O-demethylase ferredoxin subunit
MKLRLHALSWAARDVLLVEFRATDGTALPGFTAGSHVDLHLPNGLVRQYSLANDPAERHRYVLGIKRDRLSRGGSRCVHDTLRPGDLLEVGEPRNHFELVEDAAHLVFIAGGIGITPLRCMVHRAQALGSSWELHYAVRTRQEALFLEELAPLAQVHLHADDEHGGRPMDLQAIAASTPAPAHVYCCGPGPMLDAFGTVFTGWPAAQRHVEHFGAPPASREPGGAFTLVLARSGRRLSVAAGESVLDALSGAGIAAVSSCRQGICGACEVPVLAGEPDHRDILLSEEERASGKSMLICCSRSRSPELVLDL